MISGLAAAIVTAWLGAQPLRRAITAYLEWWKWHYRIEGGAWVACVLLACFGLYLIATSLRRRP